jgi:hypothetical protein
MMFVNFLVFRLCFRCLLGYMNGGRRSGGVGPEMGVTRILKVLGGIRV